MRCWPDETIFGESRTTSTAALSSMVTPQQALFQTATVLGDVALPPGPGYRHKKGTVGECGCCRCTRREENTWLAGHHHPAMLALHCELNTPRWCDNVCARAVPVQPPDYFGLARTCSFSSGGKGRVHYARPTPGTWPAAQRVPGFRG